MGARKASQDFPALGVRAFVHVCARVALLRLGCAVQVQHGLGELNRGLQSVLHASGVLHGRR